MVDALEIVPVRSPRLVREFVELPYTFYAQDPHWVPPLRRDEQRRLSPRHNPFLQHAAMNLWLARSGTRVVGRIAAIEDPLYEEIHAERVTWFGFFEAADAETARALLGTVERAAGERGCTIVRGPANPSLNESAGLLVDRFGEDPYVLMPYNPPAYPGFVEAAGYSKAKDLLAWRLDLRTPVPARLARLARLADRTARRAGVRIRALDLGAFDRDLAIVLRIYRQAWERNWGFVPPTDAEIRRLATELRPVIDPDIVLFVEIEGEGVACAVAIPDVNQVLKRMRGNLLPFGIVHFLRRRAIIDQARVVLFGVVPAARRLGLYPLLMAELHRRGVARGYKWVELSWTLEDNEEINTGIEAVGGCRHKTYRLYEKVL